MARARCDRSSYQPLTNAPPLALHWASDIIEKPLLLQAFWPLQALPALLQALWPLRELAAMHLPCAASAGVDPVETTAPARNSVAAAAANVAPDLEFKVMRRAPRLMVDDRIDAVGLDDRSITESHNEVLDARYDRNGLAEFEA